MSDTTTDYYCSNCHEFVEPEEHHWLCPVSAKEGVDNCCPMCSATVSTMGDLIDAAEYRMGGER